MDRGVLFTLFFWEMNPFLKDKDGRIMWAVQSFETRADRDIERESNLSVIYVSLLYIFSLIINQFG